MLEDQTPINDETRHMLMQLVGHTYGELHKIDNFITQGSKDLRHKSREFSQNATNIINSISTLKPNPQPPAEAVQHVPNMNIPFIDVGRVLPPPPTGHPDQLELNFNTPGIAEKILDKLTSIDTNLKLLVEREQLTEETD